MSLDSSLSVIIGLVVINVGKWLVYTGLLWGMIRIQKLNYNLPGLFASSLLAIVVSNLPFVGSYLSYAVLVICLWKCTGADIAPDVLFTVGISGALMFCFNLFVIGALMGDIKPDLSANARDDWSIAAFPDTDSGDADEMEESDGEAEGELSPPTAVSNSTAKPPTSSVSTVLRLKGVTLNSLRPSAMVFDGARVHTIFAGSDFSTDVGNGRVRYHCEQISKNGVVISGGDSERLVLPLP